MSLDSELNSKPSGTKMLMVREIESDFLFIKHILKSYRLGISPGIEVDAFRYLLMA